MWKIFVLLVLCVLVACSAPATAPTTSPSTTTPTEPAPAQPDPSADVASGPLCGTRGAAPCENPNYCQFDAAAKCGMADAPGRCVKRPEVCPEIYKPVCGCDGKTYPSDCSAAIAGTGIMAEGECPAATP